jgi:hypothetical protein
MITRARTIAFATVLALTASPVAAQVVVRGSGDRGWIGVSVEIQTTRDDSGGLTSTATITDVQAGGPADKAGIRPGDVLISIDGAMAVPRNLRTGDTVRVVIRHEGRQRLVTLAAEARPADVVDQPTLTVTFRADSMANRMYLAMDSLRARLVTGIRSGDHRVVEVGGLTPLPSPEGALPEGWTLSEVRPPFGFYIFRGEQYDSLSRAMDDLNRDIRGLRSQQAARVRELAAALRGDETRIDRNDPELVRLQRAVLDADRRSAALREAMERAARREAGAAFVGPFSPGADRPSTDPTEREARFRPLDPYLLGQNRAAGAEVVDLRPELAEYFGVEGGVLVVDVPEGTPAALAGIQPGDVVTRVGPTSVLSIQELRRGLAVSSSQIPVTVVRKGRQIQLLLPR